jgi:hypothetical protein
MRRSNRTPFVVGLASGAVVVGLVWLLFSGSSSGARADVVVLRKGRTQLRVDKAGIMAANGFYYPSDVTIETVVQGVLDGRFAEVEVVVVGDAPLGVAERLVSALRATGLVVLVKGL